MKVNSWHRDETLGNVNIPEGSNIFGSVVWANGEVDSYYKVGDGFYSVGSLFGDTPKEIIGHRAYI